MGDSQHQHHSPSTNTTSQMTFPKAVLRERVHPEVEPLNHKSLTSPQDLTVDFFSRILQDYYNEPEPIQVASLSWQPLTVAILSQVVEVRISIASPTTTPIPTAYIVKFLKPTVPLKEMFRTEGAFYQHHRSDVAFFSVPTAIYSGPGAIVLVKIENGLQYNLKDGCPPHRIPELLTGLARMHAHNWRRQQPSCYGDLAKVPGMGSALDGLKKERLFPSCYPAFMGRLQQHFHNDDAFPHDRLLCLCQDLATRRLREIHNAVHRYTPTLVHGDFHVGNLLLLENNNNNSANERADNDNDDDNDNDQWFLMDWATCGAGNPLLDVVFFLLVSTKSTPHEMFHTWLPFYYQALLQADAQQQQQRDDSSGGGSSTTRIPDELTYESCVDLFRECLLDEFLILVCYDDLGRSLIAREPLETRRFFDVHFGNVNRRSVEAVLSPDMTGYPLPPHKTAEDVQGEEKETPEWRMDHAEMEI